MLHNSLMTTHPPSSVGQFIATDALHTSLPSGGEDPNTAAVLAGQTASLFLFRSDALGALLLSFSNPALLKVDVSAKKTGLTTVVDHNQKKTIRSVVGAVSRTTCRTSGFHYPGCSRELVAAV